MRQLFIIAVALSAGLLILLAFKSRGGWVPRLGMLALAVAIVAGAAWRLAPQAMPAHDDGADLRALYAQGRVLPAGPVPVYHLGHSLVGRDMPAMLAQLAGHEYALQLGWGAPLKSHFLGRDEIAGFDTENATPQYRDAHEAMKSGEYGALVMTEMVSLRDAILYMESIPYAAKWAAEAVAGNPEIEIFLYETWHGLTDQPDWLERLPGDLQEMWSQILWSAARGAGRPVWLIPAGQVMASLVAEAEGNGGIAELKQRQDLFSDNIHLSDLGLYVVALTHYAVIYGKSPVGLPHQLMRADGTPLRAPSPELAARMQEIVWEVVTRQPWTGL